MRNARADFPGGCLAEVAAEFVFGGLILAGVLGIAAAFRSHPVVATGSVLFGLALLAAVGWAFARRQGKSSPLLAGAALVGIVLLVVASVVVEFL